METLLLVATREVRRVHSKWLCLLVFLLAVTSLSPTVRGHDGGWQRRSEQDGVALLVLGAAGQPPHLVLPAAQSGIHLCCQHGPGKRSLSKM